jgi:flagellar biogenesis protein FliO
MFTMFQRPLAREKTALWDLTASAQFLMRWLSLPKRRSAKRSLQLLESVPLTAQASIALVRFERETLVLGVTPRSVTVLTKGAEMARAAAAQPE